MIQSSKISSHKLGILNHSLYSKYEISISLSHRKSSSFLIILKLSFSENVLHISNLHIKIGESIVFPSHISFFVIFANNGYQNQKLFIPCSWYSSFSVVIKKFKFLIRSHCFLINLMSSGISSSFLLSFLSKRFGVSFFILNLLFNFNVMEKDFFHVRFCIKSFSNHGINSFISEIDTFPATFLPVFALGLTFRWIDFEFHIFSFFNISSIKSLSIFFRIIY
jgi:hypothetical protein